MNEETGDERTCGMTAGLCGIDRARAGGDPAALEAGIERLLLSYGLAMSVGMPLLYMGDEVALANDGSYRADPAKADDSRWLHRPPMDWDAVARAGVAGTVEQRTLDGLRRLLRVRAGQPAFAQGGELHVVDVHDSRVLALLRRHPEHGALLVLANVADEAVSLAGDVPGWVGLPSDAVDALDGHPAIGADGRIAVAPRSLRWLVDPRPLAVMPPVPAG